MSSPASLSVPEAYGGSPYTASSRRSRAASLRRASTSRRVATVVSHARASRGGCSGQTRSASSKRFLERVLGGVEVLAAPDQPGQHPRDEGAQGTLVRREQRLVGHAVRQSSDGPSDMTSRTSIHS